MYLYIVIAEIDGQAEIWELFEKGLEPKRRRKSINLEEGAQVEVARKMRAKEIIWLKRMHDTKKWMMMHDTKLLCDKLASILHCAESVVENNEGPYKLLFDRLLEPST